MADEGLRARKRAGTRARIQAAARALFLERGFEATTIDEIARRADISKRSFFAYFPAKEDVLVAWQEAFGDLLVARVAARPPDEPLARVVQAAMSAAIRESVSPEGVALDQMVRRTPALAGHLQLKYVDLERRLAAALAARAPPPPAPGGALVGQAALLAMVAVGALRLGSDLWNPEAPGGQTPEAYTAAVFDSLWQALGALARAAGSIDG